MLTMHTLVQKENVYDLPVNVKGSELANDMEQYIIKVSQEALEKL